MNLKHSVFFFLIIVLVAFLVGACSSSGDNTKKKPEQTQQTAQTPTNQATTETPPTTSGETPAEGTSTEGQTQASSTTGPDGTVTTQNPDGTVTVIGKDGITRVYDKDGKEISKQPNTNTPPGTTEPGANGTTPTAAPASSTTNTENITRGGVDIKNKIAIIKTNFGDLYVFFYPDIAPTHVRNFIYLAEKGFFKNMDFHRIVKGFMAQAGQRTDWPEEIPPMRLEVKPGSEAIHRPGALSAARTSDPNSATSQFFLVFTREKAQHLDFQYTVFGQMFKGFDVLDKIQNIRIGPNPAMGGQEISKPLEEVKINDVVIEDAAKYQKEIDAWKKQNAIKAPTPPKPSAAK